MENPNITYELREYLVSDGRVPDEIERARATILSEHEGGTGLFERHGIPRPWAVFRCVYGRPLSCVAFVYPWASTAARAKAFPSLYSDPAWHEFRARTNGVHEIVERIDDLIFVGSPPPAKPAGSGLFEFCRGAGEQDDRIVLGPLEPLCGRDARPFSIRRFCADADKTVDPCRKLFELIEI